MTFKQQKFLPSLPDFGRSCPYVNIFSESARKRHTDLSSTEHIFTASPAPVFACIYLRNSTLGTESEIRNLEAKNIFNREILMLAFHNLLIEISEIPNLHD